jgi:hypothetical protein
VREHANIKLRQLLEGWAPTQSEADRIRTHIQRDPRRRAYPPDIIVGDDRYYIDFLGIVQRSDERVVAEAGSRFGLTFERVKKPINTSMLSPDTYVADLTHDEVLTLRYRNLQRQGRLYQFVKRS